MVKSQKNGRIKSNLRVKLPLWRSKHLTNVFSIDNIYKSDNVQEINYLKTLETKFGIFWRGVKNVNQVIG